MTRPNLLRLAIVAACLVMPAAAADFRDTNGRFSVSVPEGWTSEVPANASDVTILLSRGTPADATGAACIGLYLDMPETRTATQAELNTAVEAQLTEEFWKAANQASGDTSFKVLSTGKRDIAGRRVHNVVFAGTVVREGKRDPGKGKMEVHFIPGAMHSMICATREAAFALNSAAFETIFMSYRPNVAPLIAQLPPGTPSALTLFARAAQSGKAQVVSADTPDTQRAGLDSGAASLTVDGAGSWQVCSGTNYTGNCAAITGPANAPFAVLSARRSPAALSPAEAAQRALYFGRMIGASLAGAR